MGSFGITEPLLPANDGTILPLASTKSFLGKHQFTLGRAPTHPLEGTKTFLPKPHSSLGKKNTQISAREAPSPPLGATYSSLGRNQFVHCSAPIRRVEGTNTPFRRHMFIPSQAPIQPLNGAIQGVKLCLPQYEVVLPKG